MKGLKSEERRLSVAAVAVLAALTVLVVALS